MTTCTGAYALVLTEPASRVFSDDLFFPEFVGGVREELRAAGRHLMLTLASMPHCHDRIERYVRDGHVDGVMIASMHGTEPLLPGLCRAGPPVVASGRPLHHSSIPFIDIDHAAGVQAAVRYLVARGRTRIATIAGPQDMVAGLDRLAGYQAACADTDRPAMVAVGDFTRESGARAMRALLAGDPAVDAVVVASDLMAEGALRVLREAGRRVPDDVALVGFDDVETARRAEPPLTTVRQPIGELGRRLARQMVRLAEGEDIESELILPTELIVRCSTS